MSRLIGSVILEGANTCEDTVILNETSTASEDAIIADGGRNCKRVVATGTLQDLGVENRNKRIYAKADMEPEINGPRMTELIKAKQFCGEYGHPLSEDLVRQQTIDPKLVAVRYEKVWIEGNLIKGVFRGTNNNYGEYFDNDLRDGCKPAFSLRALGSIETKGGKAYVKGIKIITWDSVIFPSHKAAYTEKIVTESAMNGTPIAENQIVVPENDPGKIITLTESDARTVINRLQKESANLSLITEAFDGLMDNITYLKESNQILMSTRYGERISVNLENHVDNLIMDYCFKM